MNTPAAKGQGPRAIPGTWLESLAARMKLSGVEWRVIALVLAGQPLSAWRIAQRLRLPYTHAKRAARELVRWNVLMGSPEGLRFQPDAGRWEPATKPVPGGSEKAPSPKSPGANRRPPDKEDPSDEVILR